MWSDRGPLGSEPAPALQPASDSPAETTAQISSLCGLGGLTYKTVETRRVSGYSVQTQGSPQGYSLAAPGSICYGRLHMPPTTTPYHLTHSETSAGNLHLRAQALCWESQEGPTAFRTPLPSPHHSLQKGAANRGGFSL